MNYFLKLNIVSILYAMMFFIPTELLLNVYRIARITNWQIETVNLLTAGILLVDIIGGTFVINHFTNRWMKWRKSNLWTILLWFPYFILFIYLFAHMIPITNGGDVPNPVTGLLVLFGLVIFPFYILIFNLFTFKDVKQT